VNTGEVIRQARQARGLTQVQLAEQAETTQGTISRIESGDLIPRVDDLARIADALGTTAADLLQQVA
jgi:transcriptional regulator with XRE-family HTH domain